MVCMGDEGGCRAGGLRPSAITHPSQEVLSDGSLQASASSHPPGKAHLLEGSAQGEWQITGYSFPQGLCSQPVSD